MKTKFDLDYSIEKDYPAYSVAELVARFYRYHTYRIKKKTTIKARAVKPNALKLNPSKIVPKEEISQDIWYAVYCRGYWIKITQHERKLRGPHKAELFIQIYPGKQILLAVMQVMAMFFDKKAMRRKLRLSITKKKWYYGERAGEEIILFDEPIKEKIEL